MEPLLMNENFVLPEHMLDSYFKGSFNGTTGRGVSPDEYFKGLFYMIFGKEIPFTYPGMEVFQNKDADFSGMFKGFIQFPYPFKDEVYFMSGDKVLEVKTQEAYQFNRLRLVMYQQWGLQNYKGDKVYEIGDKSAPINIKNLGVDLTEV